MSDPCTVQLSGPCHQDGELYVLESPPANGEIHFQYVDPPNFAQSYDPEVTTGPAFKVRTFRDTGRYTTEGTVARIFELVD